LEKVINKMAPKPDIEQILEIKPNSRRRKWLKRGLFPVLVLLAAGAAAGFWNNKNQSTAPRYQTEAVRHGNLTVIVTATGTLQPTNKVDVGSELSGMVKSVEADFNNRVRKGEVLVRLDTSKLEAQLTQSRAALEAAQAKTLLALATVRETRAKLEQFQKVRELSRNRVPSQTEFDAAEAAFERAGADAANAAAAASQARATVQANETDLAKSVIRSPINGIVLTRSIEPGQTVAASFTAPVLFTLAEDLTQMELHVNVDEADIGKVQEGQEAVFTVAAYPNRRFAARITQARYGSSTTSGVVTYETVLKVGNPDLALRPGMTATADITVSRLEQVLLVPSAALRFTPPVKQEKKPSASLVGSLLPRPPGPSSEKPTAAADKGRQQVWILKEGQLASVPVTPGSTDGTWTEITAGLLTPGAAVVTEVLAGIP
jgi:HlyD family secretion protein